MKEKCQKKATEKSDGKKCQKKVPEKSVRKRVKEKNDGKI